LATAEPARHPRGRDVALGREFGGHWLVVVHGPLSRRYLGVGGSRTAADAKVPVTIEALLYVGSQDVVRLLAEDDHALFGSDLPVQDTIGEERIVHVVEHITPAGG